MHNPSAQVPTQTAHNYNSIHNPDIQNMQKIETQARYKQTMEQITSLKIFFSLA